MSRAPFLHQVAEYYYRLLGSGISEKTFVFPSRRALLFFRHYLGEIADKPIFAPHCTTINDFIVSLLPEYQLLDRTALLFELYQSYQETRGDKLTESFDEFIYWGNIILKDYDLIDRYLVSAKELYTNIHEFKQMQDDFSYMEENTLDILRGFWGKFEGLGIHSELVLSDQSSSRERFLDFWLSLYPLYERFNERLREQKCAYEGQIYRIIAERAADIVASLSEDTALVFVGLFENTPSEFRLFRALRRREYAEFCWDEQVHIVADEEHRAHRMMSKNKELLGYVRGSWSLPTRTLPRSVTVVSCASTVSQVKALPLLLSDLGVDLTAEGNELDLTTAIILPNENLLLPTVGSIPDTYKHLNITLGYPLSRTPVAIMLKRWIELLGYRQGNAYRVDKLLGLFSLQLLSERFPTLNVLTSSLGRQRNFRLSADWLRRKYTEIRQQTEATILASEPTLEGFSDILELFINKEHNSLSFLSALKSLLEALLFSSRLVGAELEKDEEGDLFTEEDNRPELGVFDAEFIHHYILLINRLRTLIEDYKHSGLTLETTAKLLDSLSQGLTIPFEGDPLRGLQIMGLLESRLLHFRNLVYLSAQEGQLPTDSSTSTLIPYAIRAGYYLPTPEFIEAAESYRFYQSISGVEHLVMIYGKEDSIGGRGEESRYVLQLEYLYGVQINRKTAQATPRVSGYTPIEIAKDTPDIKARLERYFSRGEQAKALSASRLSTYISCPLRFYYESIMEIYEEQAPEELMASNDFGSILHRTMEMLYDSYKDAKVIPKSYIESLLSEGNTQVSRIIKEQYSRLYERSNLSTLDKLYCGMLETYVRGILEHDHSSAGELAYVDSECKVWGQVALSDGRSVNIKGDIDRIDILYRPDAGPHLRLIDYKTGGDKKKDIYDWTKLFTDKDYKAQMQILLYCELVHSGRTSQGVHLDKKYPYPIQPGIMLVRTMASEPENYIPYLRHGSSSRDVELLEDYTTVREPYLTELRLLLDEMFDLNTPFTQTQDPDACAYCPFSLSCGR